MGLFDAAIINDPGRLANLQLGLGLLGAASGTGRGIANAFGGAIQSAQQSQELERRRQMQELERMMAQQQYGMNERTMQRQDRADAAAQTAQRNRQAYLQGLQGLDPQAALSRGGGPTLANAQAMESRKPTVTDALLAGFSLDEARQLVESGNWGRPKVARTVETTGPDGRPMVVQLDEFGRPVGDGMAAWKAPIQINRGGSIDLVDPATGKPRTSFGVTMSPGERDASARGWAGVNLSREQFNYNRAKDAVERQDRLAGGDPSKVTEGERNAANYALRMTEATRLLDQFEKSGKASLLTQGAGAIPFVGGLAQRAVMSADQQQYRQAAEDWIRAKLRKESGAVIGKDEMDAEYITYFPVPGDTPQVIEQKRRAREVANQGMIGVSGRAFNMVQQPQPQRSGGGATGGWGEPADLGGGFRVIGVK